MTSVNNIDRRRGDNRAFTFNLKDENGDALDLTSYTSPVLAVNTLEDPPDAVTEVFKVSGAIDATPTTGIVTFSPTTGNMDQTPAKYYYDAQILDGAGAVFTFSRGYFRITQDIAKD